MPKHNFRDFQGEVGKEKNHGADQVGSHASLFVFTERVCIGKKESSESPGFSTHFWTPC